MTDRLPRHCIADIDARLGRIANAGYEKTSAADSLNHLTLAEFDPATQTALEKILPPYVTVDPMLDLTPMAVGVPTFPTANRAMNCLNAFVRYRLTREAGNLSEWLK